MLTASGGPLARTHAMLPTPLVLPDRVRVYYAACDDDLRGRIFFADFGLEPPFPLMARSEKPSLDLGAAGAFDADGVNPSQIVQQEDRLALLYIGWRRGPDDTPYTLFGGLAFSEDGGLTFDRAGPLLRPCDGERLFRTAPFLERTGDGWRLLYIGGDRFVTGEHGKRLPIYSLMELRSPTPWEWTGPGRELLAPDVEGGELGFGRPVSLGGERLMLSVRSRSGYELVETALGPGAARRPVLPDGREPWEAQMTCFGAPCQIGDRELLFYNGDGFGRTGMGLAWRRLS
ncbi:hypothetical protein [Phenylobacterium sp.]|uniref:hypothetical protein n=1 Tax=Phenylobacterium sp. TaxID=1871053 RepID=UPI002810CC11|nr:hypothetical protein [Phenylobacterium sp.]